jgi:hypothetical protein
MNTTGNLATEGPVTQYWFEYGTDTSYGSKTPVRTTASVINASERITGLVPNTTYHYRAVAESAAGVNYGEDMTFTTPPEVPE